MIVERTAAKKSIAVSLILALGLSLPGSTAWSQTFNARVNPGASAAGASAASASAAASVTGALSGVSVVPSLSAGTLSALTAPVLSAPAAAPSALAFVPSALTAVSVAPAAAKAASIPAAARAAVSPAKAPVKAPQAAPTPLASLSNIAGESASAISAVEVVSVGRMFDGSSAEARTPALDLTGRGPLAFSPNRLRAAAAPSFTPASPAATPVQQRMVRTLHQVASIFAEQYAPLDLKKGLFELDLKREYDKAKAAILADPDITTRKFQDLLATLVAAMRDYHVSISFHSTESSKLPFSVAGAEGRYFLTFIDREKLPKEVFPFEMGDELVSFAGKPTAEAVKAIAARMTPNVAETDMRMAELFLTNRRRARGDNDIPQGAADLVIRRKGDFYKVRLPWDYTPELIAQDVPARNAGMLEPEGFDGAGPVSAGFFSSVGKAIVAAVHPLIDLFANMRAESADNPFMIGARKSFVPRLGKVLWRSDEDSHFDAYIFETKDGKKKGYVRIAAYDGDYAEVREFAKLMEKFQAETDALVIDQVSNPGGSVFYLYALASHLTDKVLVAPRHRMIIGEADAHQSAELLLTLMRNQKNPPKEKKKVKEGEEEEPPNAGGYPITAKFMQLMVRSAQYILQQFTEGKRYTGLIHVSGVDDIDPAPKASERYTKPILLLTNALDFSGGDFFPAILQDNKRATIIGVRTAGAGGIVRSFSVNQFGIDRLSATTSLAERPNGKPIENLGVTPEIPYEITARDLRTGFAEYRWKILKALEGLLDPGPAPPAAPAAPQDEK